MKPKKLAKSTIVRVTREIAGHMAVLEATVEQVVAANDFIDDGRRGVDYAAVRRGGGEGTGPERAAMSRPDMIGSEAAEFMTLLESSLRNARRLRSLAVTLGINWDADAKAAANFVAKKENGEGDCVNCGRYVPGTREDRLRQDRCEACARYWSRHNREKERPRHLWGGDSIDDSCQMVRTRHGIDSKCELAYGHDGECRFGIGSRRVTTGLG